MSRGELILLTVCYTCPMETPFTKSKIYTPIARSVVLFIVRYLSLLPIILVWLFTGFVCEKRSDKGDYTV